VGVGRPLGERKKEKKSEGEGVAAAAWRRDRFRVSLFFSFFQTGPHPFFSIFSPGNFFLLIFIGEMLLDLQN
jgi:hypothetical protein